VGVGGKRKRNEPRGEAARSAYGTHACDCSCAFPPPPLLGKTTAARLLGRAFYALDVLASSEVVSVSAMQLQAPYMGQTAPLVRNTFRAALGKTLVIDECYALEPNNNGSHGRTFMKEAIDELVSILTEEEFRGKLVVVLAGYTDETRHMLRSNPGLASRFPEEIEFASFTVAESLQLLRRNLADKQSYELTPLPNSPEVCSAMQAIVDNPTFASGRDIDTLVTHIELAMMDLPDDTTSIVPESLLVRVLTEFARRQQQKKQGSHLSLPLPSSAFQHATHLPHQHHFERTLTAATNKEDGKDKSSGEHDSHSPTLVCHTAHVRDAGVSDAVWRQLQLDAKNQADVNTNLQARLQKMGVCPQGFTWIRQNGGYRCAGGSHWISDQEIGTR
jgi:hypothetical protein